MESQYRSPCSIRFQVIGPKKKLVFCNTTFASWQNSKIGSTLAALNSALKTPYSPLPYIFWILWTWGITRYHLIYTIPVKKKLSQSRWSDPIFGLVWAISELGSPVHIVISPILILWVFWVIQMMTIFTNVVNTWSPMQMPGISICHFVVISVTTKN